MVLMVGSFCAQVIQSRQLSPKHVYRFIPAHPPTCLHTYLPTYLPIHHRCPDTTYSHEAVYWGRPTLQILGRGWAACLPGQRQHGLAVPVSGGSQGPGMGGSPGTASPSPSPRAVCILRHQKKAGIVRVASGHLDHMPLLSCCSRDQSESAPPVIRLYTTMHSGPGTAFKNMDRCSGPRPQGKHSLRGWGGISKCSGHGSIHL